MLYAVYQKRYILLLYKYILVILEEGWMFLIKNYQIVDNFLHCQNLTN